MTAVLEVLDIKNTDYRGIPKQLIKVSTKDEYDNTVNSWYTDGTSLWIHTFDNRQPNPSQDIMFIRNIRGWNISLGTCELIL